MKKQEDERMNITNEMILAGAEKYIKTFKQIEKIAQTDGSMDSALRLIQEVYPEYTTKDLNMLLVSMDYAKLIEGLTIIDKQVMEPIRPRLTDKAIAEMDKRREAAKEHA